MGSSIGCASCGCAGHDGDWANQTVVSPPSDASIFTDHKLDGNVSPCTSASTEAPSSCPASPEKASTTCDGVDVDFVQAFAMGALSEESIAELERSMEAVRALCAQGRVFDAGEAYAALRKKASSLPPAYPVKGGTLRDALLAWDQEPMIIGLKGAHLRMTQILACMGPRAMPGDASDRRWVHHELTDLNIGPDFKADIKIRFADSGERDPHGSSTQLVTWGHLKAFPMDLTRFVSVYRETDLYQKEWIADCESCEGQVAGVDKLYSATSRIINASPILPVKIEVLTVREFAVCPTAPMSNRGPGVLVMDMGAPSDATEFAGWPVPPPVSRLIRLNGLGLIMYFVPRHDKPGHCDVFAFAKAGVPIPQFLVPLSLIKRFLANHFLSVFRAVKQHIVDNWDALGYKDRIAACPAFYDSISSVSRG